MSYKVIRPEAAYVHYAPDSNIILGKLMTVEPLRIALSQGSPVERNIGNLTILAEPYSLSANGMVSFGWERNGTIEYPIVGSAYCVRSPVPLIALGKRVPPSDAQLKCWKVILRSEEGEYDLSSRCDWSLSACDIDDSSEPTFEICRCTRLPEVTV
jgi:hypothetical protein